MKSRESLEPSFSGINYPEVGDVIFLKRARKFARIYKLWNLDGFPEGHAETLEGDLFGISQDVPIEGMTVITPVSCVIEDYHYKLIQYTGSAEVAATTREFTFEYACPAAEEWFLERSRRKNEE